MEHIKYEDFSESTQAKKTSVESKGKKPTNGKSKNTNIHESSLERIEKLLTSPQKRTIKVADCRAADILRLLPEQVRLSRRTTLEILNWYRKVTQNLSMLAMTSRSSMHCVDLKVDVHTHAASKSETPLQSPWMMCAAMSILNRCQAEAMAKVNHKEGSSFRHYSGWSMGTPFHSLLL